MFSLSSIATDARPVEEYGPKQIENFEKRRVVAKDEPELDEAAQASTDEPPALTTFQWLDEMLFGWSASKKADEGSQPVSRSEEGTHDQNNDTYAAVGEEGDFDAVVSFVSWIRAGMAQTD